MSTIPNQRVVSSPSVKILSALGLSLGLGLSALAAETLPPVPAPTEPAGMKVLFNGKDLAGWSGGSRFWSVKDGVMRGETTNGHPATDDSNLVLYDRKHSDFDLRFAFRCSAAYQSGVQYRSGRFVEPTPTNAWASRGYQCELRNGNDFPNVSGSLNYEASNRGRICLVGEKAVWENGKKTVAATLIDAAGYVKLFKLNDWNEVVIIAKGNHIQHFLNGTQILDFTDKDPQLALTQGSVILLLHAGAPMWAEFKNLRIKEL